MHLYQSRLPHLWQTGSASSRRTGRGTTRLVLRWQRCEKKQPKWTVTKMMRSDSCAKNVCHVPCLQVHATRTPPKPSLVFLLNVLVNNRGAPLHSMLVRHSWQRFIGMCSHCYDCSVGQLLRLTRYDQLRGRRRKISSTPVTN